MANKQTTPGLVGVQGSYVNTNGNPLIPQSGWKSPLRQVAQIGEQAVNLAKEYQDIKFDGYQAQYSIMANQMYHEMQDATDPMQIDEIQKKYEQKFAEPIDDSVWAKSYLNSTYRQKWDATVKDNTQKIRFTMQHKFNNIETEKTLNSMAMAAASTGDIGAMTSYFDSGVSLIDKSTHLSVDEKNTLKKKFAVDFVNSCFNANPNLANSFTQQYAQQLAPYGVDANEVKTKTDTYNIQQENRLYTKEQRAKKAAQDAATDMGAKAVFDYLKIDNPSSEDDARMDAVMEEVSKVDPVYALKMQKIIYPENKETTAKNKYINDLADMFEKYEELPPNEEKAQLKLDITDKLDSGRVHKYINDTDLKYYYKKIGLEEDGQESILNIAKSMTESQLNEYLAENGGNYKTAQINAAKEVNKEYSGFNGKVQYIEEMQGLVSDDVIKSWGFNAKQTAELIDKAQTERKNNNRGSIEFENLSTELDSGNLSKDFKPRFNKLPSSERDALRKKAKDILDTKKEVYEKQLRSAVNDGKISDEDIREDYVKGRIDKDAADDLIAINKYVKDKNVHTITSGIISNILDTVNGTSTYKSLGDLNRDLAKLKNEYNHTNMNEYKSFMDFARTLYTDVNSEFKANVKTVIDQIEDAIVSKNPQFDLDTETRRKLAIFKNVIAKQMTKEYQEGSLAGKEADIAKKYDIINILPLWNNFAPSKEEIRNSYRNKPQQINTTDNLENVSSELGEIYKTRSILNGAQDVLNIDNNSSDEPMEFSLTNQGSK